MSGKQTRPRQRNARGEGYRLRDDILHAASGILERTGSEEALSLRGIAQEVGISAPAIYRHFADLATIIDAVVADHLTDLASRLTAAADAASDPVGALVGAWMAYLEFGRERPGSYRVIFERRFLPLWDDEQRAMVDTAPLFEQTISMMVGLLQACIDAGCSTSADAFADSVAVWYLAHGMVSLPTTITSFPWPDRTPHVTSAIRELAHLTAG